MDLAVKFKGKVVFHLNERLVEKQRRTEEDIVKIKALHVERLKIENKMQKLDPKQVEQLRDLNELWTDNQFELQKAWGFPRNSNMHRRWSVPHCTCPKFDNDERLGTGAYIINGNCPIHS